MASWESDQFVVPKVGKKVDFQCYVTFKCYEKVTNRHGKSLNLWAQTWRGRVRFRVTSPFFRKLEKDSQVKKEINKSWKS